MPPARRARGIANSTAPYWAGASAADGHATSTGMLSGAYSMTVYKNELAVASGAVSVAAGATSTAGSIAIAADPSSTVALWRIGDWDGSPKEFLNGDKISALVLGQNVLVLSPASGTAGTGYTSPGYAYDALDLLKTP